MNWKVKNLVAKIQAYDAIRPTLFDKKTAGISVSPGPYYPGSAFYVSVPFSEIVRTSDSTKRLNTTWGPATYEAGDDSNVITFKGTIAADARVPLQITNCVCVFKDIATNIYQYSGTVNTTLNKSFVDAVVEIPSWAGSGTQADPYRISTTNELNRLVANVRRRPLHLWKLSACT